MILKFLEFPLKSPFIVKNFKELSLKRIKKIVNMRLRKMFPTRISRQNHRMMKKLTKLENLARRERKLSNMQEDEL